MTNRVQKCKVAQQPIRMAYLDHVTILCSRQKSAPLISKPPRAAKESGYLPIQSCELILASLGDCQIVRVSKLKLINMSAKHDAGASINVGTRNSSVSELDPCFMVVKDLLSHAKTFFYGTQRISPFI